MSLVRGRKFSKRSKSLQRGRFVQEAQSEGRLGDEMPAWWSGVWPDITVEKDPEFPSILNYLFPAYELLSLYLIQHVHKNVHSYVLIFLFFLKKTRSRLIISHRSFY